MNLTFNPKFLAFALLLLLSFPTLASAQSFQSPGFSLEAVGKWKYYVVDQTDKWKYGQSRLIFDLGTRSWDAPNLGPIKIKVKNLTDSNLVFQRINWAEPCCWPKFSRDPIPPGDSMYIEYTCDTRKRTGYQKKTATLRANSGAGIIQFNWNGLPEGLALSATHINVGLLYAGNKYSTNFFLYNHSQDTFYLESFEEAWGCSIELAEHTAPGPNRYPQKRQIVPDSIDNEFRPGNRMEFYVTFQSEIAEWVHKQVVLRFRKKHEKYGPDVRYLILGKVVR